MPRHLADYDGSSASDYSAFIRERREWMQAHGIDPGDWSQVQPLLKATWKRWGIESSADRARRRLRITAEDA